MASVITRKVRYVAVRHRMRNGATILETDIPKSSLPFGQDSNFIGDGKSINLR